MDHQEIVARLYQQHAHAIFKYIFSSLAQREEAEDILVEVFLAALKYQGLTRMSEQQRFAWLLAVARNKVADWYRRRSHLLHTFSHSTCELRAVSFANMPKLQMDMGQLFGYSSIKKQIELCKLYCNLVL